MKDALLLMLKFNIKIALLFGALIFFVFSNDSNGYIRDRTMEKIILISLVILLLYAALKNLRILWDGRAKIKTSVESVAIELTAAAIELKNKAEVRIQERSNDQLFVNKGDMKQCPFCAELIKKQAIVCRYCGKSFSI